MHRDARLPRATRYACVCAETEQGDGRELGMLGIARTGHWCVGPPENGSCVWHYIVRTRVSLSSRYGI